MKIDDRGRTVIERENVMESKSKENDLEFQGNASWQKTKEHFLNHTVQLLTNQYVN